MILLSLTLSAVLVCATTAVTPGEMRELHRGVTSGKGAALFADLLFARSDPICQNKTRSCQDCSTVNLCAYVGNSYILSSTKACPPATPYCNHGECTTAQPSVDCLLPPKEPNFKCFPGMDGYFPAADDCRTYFICHNETAYEYKCPTGHIYNIKQAMCEPLKSASQCFTFRCEGNEDKYLRHPVDETHYVYCRYNTNSRSGMWVSRCPNNYRITSSDVAACEVYCTKPARIPDKDNLQRYWECRYIGGDGLLEPVLQSCPTGMLFNDTHQRCVGNRTVSSLIETAVF